MPSPFRKNLIHDAVLYKRIGFGADGQPVYDSGSVVRVRFDDTLIATSEPDKSTTKEDAAAVVALDIPLRSLLLRGFEPTGTGQVDDLYEVTRFDKTDDVRGRDQYREVGLMRFRGTLPNA